MKTTKKHFEIFKKECEKWIKAFGLHGWERFYFHENKDKNVLAQCTVTPEARQVSLYLTIDWGKDFQIAIEQLKRTAFHEVGHVFLAKYRDLADRRFDVANTDLEGCEHEIIHTLESVVFDIRS